MSETRRRGTISKEPQPKKRRNTAWHKAVSKRTQAAVLLAAGIPSRTIAEITGISRNTVFDVKAGRDPLTADIVEGLKHCENAKWTLLQHAAIDAVLDDTAKLKKASPRDLTIIAGIAKDKRDGIEVTVQHTAEADMSNEQLVEEAKEAARRVEDFQARLERLEHSRALDYSGAVDAEITTD